MRHIRISLFKRIELSARYYRIHKETTGITCHFRVGQFFKSDTHYGVTKVFKSKHTSLFLQLRTDISIIKLPVGLFFQSIRNVRHYILTLQLILEDTLTIAVLTLTSRETANTSGRNLYGINLYYQVFRLNAIRADVLHSRSSYLTRNKRQVFGSIPLMVYRISHEIIPYHTSTYTHIESVFIFAHYRHTLNGRMQYHAVKIASKEQIASTAYMQPFSHLALTRLQEVLQLFYRAIFNKT